MLQVAENSIFDEAPRERAEKHGVGVLTNSELWALILRTGMPGLPITTLTSNLMKANQNSLQMLARRNREELTVLDGVGMVKAIQVEAVFELARRYFREEALEKPVIRSSEDIYRHMVSIIGNLPHEEIWAIYLQRNNKIICERKITTGSGTASLFDVKKTLRNALTERAEAMVLCHNHPSGNLIPSPQDRDITRKTREACRALDIMFLDHLIVTSHGYYSFADKGDL